MKKLNCVLFVVILLNSFGICFNYKHSYTAAVVDYVHIYEETANEEISANVNEYVKLINVAARNVLIEFDVIFKSNSIPNEKWNFLNDILMVILRLYDTKLSKIIVFPEYGLVHISTMYRAVEKGGVGLDPYSTFVPDPALNSVPCDDEKMVKYSMHLVTLSCAARDDEIYTIVNLLEKSTNNETQKLEFHNTNVVMDRKGTVIARYRKIKLSEEPFLTAGTELVTFKTDFGVTFGIFTCFDLLFHYPALDVLSLPNVTDIIFPTAWYSESPFLQALSITHGYSKANRVNLLVACLQEPTNYDGGSGIFLANGTIAGTFISYNRVTEMVIREVPIISNKSRNEECKYKAATQDKAMFKKKEERAQLTAQINNIGNFTIKSENITAYKFSAIMEGQQGICTDDREFCCTFIINIDNSSTTKPDYIYKMAIFNGQSEYGSSVLGGVRTCALLACYNASDSSCGHKINDNSLTSQTFNSIYIKTAVDYENDSYNQPATLRHDLQPVSDYTYCETANNNGRRIIITMATTAPQKSLLTFGIYGRLYSNDATVTPKPPTELEPLNYTLIIMIVSFSVIIMISIAGIMYKCCMKET